MSPPANSVHAAAGSYVGAFAAAAGRSTWSGHASSVATRSTPNRAWRPHASARTDASTSPARRNARRSRFSARSPARVSASAARISRLASVGRATPRAARIGSASASTSSSASYRPLVPARTSCTSRSEVELNGVRNWVTGTTAVRASCGVGDGAAVGSAAGEAVAEADPGGPLGDPCPVPVGATATGDGDGRPAGARTVEPRTAAARPRAATAPTTSGARPREVRRGR
jgi:hypothetical protein